MTSILPRPSARTSTKFQIYAALAALVLIVGTSLISAIIQPKVLSALLYSNPQIVPPTETLSTPQQIKYPYAYDSGATPIEGSIELELQVPQLHPTLYSVFVDDCINWIEINGAQVLSPSIPYCDYLKPLEMDLSGYLRSGSNIMRLGYRNHGGPARLYIHSSDKDRYALYINVVRFVAIGVLCLVLASKLRDQVGAGRLVQAAFICGVILRLTYLYETPYRVRGYDVDGHIQYIRQLATSLRIPLTNEGWEAYQPPLYYFIASLVYRLAIKISDSEEALYAVQALSTTISIAMLYLSILVIAQLPFPKRRSVGLAISSFFLAALPAPIMAGARINNDPLVQFLMLATFAVLYKWWAVGSWQQWYSAVGLLCLAILTKSTALTLVPLFAICLFCSKHTPIRTKSLLAIGGMMIAAMMIGWYVFYRLLIDNQNHLIGSIGSLNAKLKVDSSLWNFLILNPAKVLEHPFNNPWLDSTRRAYVWEYLVRSALFGEFNLGEPLKFSAQLLVGSMLAILVLAIPGLLAGLSYATTPVYLLLISQLSAIAAIRWISPFACHQDFRFILIASLPVAYLFARSAVGYSKTWLALSTSAIIMFVVFAFNLVFML